MCVYVCVRVCVSVFLYVRVCVSVCASFCLCVVTAASLGATHAFTTSHVTSFHTTSLPHACTTAGCVMCGYRRYWQEFLAELRRVTSEKFGAEFIDDCLSMEVEDVKAKYGA